MAENEMVGWHHQFDGHEFEQAQGVGDGQGGLACYSPWHHKESDTTEQLNWTELKSAQSIFCSNEVTLGGFLGGGSSPERQSQD